MMVSGVYLKAMEEDNYLTEDPQDYYWEDDLYQYNLAEADDYYAESDFYDGINGEEYDYE